MSEYEMDLHDWALLDALQQDASLSNQALAERVGLSAPTTLRRVRRLRELGLIERQVAILNEDAVAARQGHGLSVIAEVSLERQGSEHLDAFEQRAVQEAQVQQCWRVSPGPDFVLVARVPDMPAWHELTRRLFSQDANVRNVRAFFAVRRGKFDTRLPLVRGG